MCVQLCVTMNETSTSRFVLLSCDANLSFVAAKSMPSTSRCKQVCAAVHYFRSRRESGHTEAIVIARRMYVFRRRALLSRLDDSGHTVVTDIARRFPPQQFIPSTGVHCVGAIFSPHIAPRDTVLRPPCITFACRSAIPAAAIASTLHVVLPRSSRRTCSNHT